MYLQPYIHPRVRMIGAMKESSSSNQLSLNTNEQNTGHMLSLSQNNLLQVPGDDLHLMNKVKSFSMCALPLQDVLPTIKVEPVEQSRGRSLTEGSNNGSSSSNESLCACSLEDVRRSRTPQPASLNPDRVLKSLMTSSTSEPNVVKSPSTPKVPPRPRAQEILKRCTTVTRKNATRNQLGVVQCH